MRGVLEAPVDPSTPMLLLLLLLPQGLLPPVLGLDLALFPVVGLAFCIDTLLFSQTRPVPPPLSL